MKLSRNEMSPEVVGPAGGQTAVPSPACAVTVEPPAPRRTRSNSIRSALRSPAAVAVLIAGAVHVPLVDEHLREAPYVGLLFIGLAVACGAVGFLLIWRDTRTVWRLAAAITGAAAVGYLASRTVGLPEISDDIGHWSDPLGTIALTAETATVILASFALRHHEPNPHATRLEACATARESASTEGKDVQ